MRSRLLMTHPEGESTPLLERSTRDNCCGTGRDTRTLSYEDMTGLRVTDYKKETLKRRRKKTFHFLPLSCLHKDSFGRVHYNMQLLY